MCVYGNVIHLEKLNNSGSESVRESTLGRKFIGRKSERESGS